jgi:hypothetical protein
MGGEETSLFERIFGDGFSGRWVPGAVVYHHVPRENQTVQYLRRYFRAQGEYLARARTHERCRLLFGRPRWLIRRAIEAEVEYRLRRLFCGSPTWIDSLILSSRLWGMLKASGGCQAGACYPAGA